VDLRNEIITSLPKDPAERLKLFMDPWIFISTCVFTKDEVAKTDSTKPAPIDLYYLYALTRGWEAHNKVSIVKSRRMWLTWLMCALHLHMAMTQPDRNIFLVSMSEDFSIKLIEKCKFIYNHIPEDVWPMAYRPKMNDKRADRIVFDELGSRMSGIPMGKNKLRSETASAIMADEFAFWELAEESYAAFMPCIEGGGKVTLLTTVEPGSYAKKIHFDMMDDEKV